nr:uncharacterized protein CTRU02_09558 [Colletotrichum truncatum]KAF6788240.1 hypothetical protein CTRU02_09558 [Colletotrichum truncatum]
MDPFAALGLAAAIIQFVEFGAKIVATSREIYVSSSGLTQEHETLDEICSHLCVLVDDIDDAADAADKPRHRIEEEGALKKLSERCKSTALELQRVLNGLYQTPGGRIASLNQALKATWGKRKVKDVELKLKEYRQELIAHLVAITNNNQSSALRELRALKEVMLSIQSNHSGKLEEISEAIQNIAYQSSITKESPSDTAAFTWKDFQQLHEKLFDIIDNARDISLQQKFLRGLNFRSMTARRHSIVEAHQKTFNWVFKGTNAQTSAPAPNRNLSNWLKSGKGIFWISGKAGSGKSTLMKYLGCHPHTSDLLSTWSQPKECIVACHYFWSSGTRLQKSINGLLRSLLFEIFRQLPEIIAKVVPDDLCHFENDSSLLSSEDGRNWLMDELDQITSHLVSSEDLSLRFCFFIDGLDEYDGDHQKLIQILARLASSPNVKLCVSSRPWNIFEDAYGKSSLQKLALQDLTQDDIRSYTKSMLKEHPNWIEYAKDQHSIADEITKKAQGVFLWVFLVVRSVHEGVTNGDAVSTLRRRVSQLPQDLEAFFKHILNSIDPFYHRQMAKFFQIALQAEEPLSIMLYSCIESCTEDVSDVLHIPVEPMDKHDVFTRRKQMIRRINGRSKGLLEIQADHAASDYLGPRVTFLHRTVRDFLLTREMTEFLNDRLTDFKARTVIFRAYVALVKSMPVRKEHFKRSGELSRVLDQAFFYAYQAELESGDSEAELVDDLRYVVEEMADSLDIQPPWNPDYFIEFVISRGLSQYLTQHRECNVGARDIVNGAFLVKAVMESLKPVNEYSPDITEVISLLLVRGTDPNRGSRIQQDKGLKVPAKGTNYMALMWGIPREDRQENRNSRLTGGPPISKVRMKDIFSIEGSIWGNWLQMLSLSLVEHGMSFTWAIRQKRILDLLIGHGADVNETSASDARH